MHKILLAIAALACLANTGDQIEALTDSGEYAAAFSIAREAAEAGDVIAFLASERASYLTGIAVNIDGGTSPVV